MESPGNNRSPSLTAGHSSGPVTVGSGSSSKPTFKRNRNQLSCTHCRNGKLKCDRALPCFQCVKRGRSSNCVFPALVPSKEPIGSMKDRLKHLETLVKGAMASQDGPENQSSSSMAVDETDSQYESPLNISGSGRLLQGPTDPTYVGATHWAAILDDVGLIAISPSRNVANHARLKK